MSPPGDTAQSRPAATPSSIPGWSSTPWWSPACVTMAGCRGGTVECKAGRMVCTGDMDVRSIGGYGEIHVSGRLSCQTLRFVGVVRADEDLVCAGDVTVDGILSNDRIISATSVTLRGVLESTDVRTDTLSIEPLHSMMLTRHAMGEYNRIEPRPHRGRQCGTRPCPDMRDPACRRRGAVGALPDRAVVQRLACRRRRHGGCVRCSARPVRRRISSAAGPERRSALSPPRARTAGTRRCRCVPSIGDGAVATTSNPHSSAHAATAASARSRNTGSSTMPPLPRCPLPTSNCGLTRSTICASGAAMRAITGMTYVNEMNETSETTIRGR